MRDRRVAGAAIGPLGVVVAVQGFDEATGESVEFLHGVAPDEWAALPIEGVIGPGAVYPDWVVVGPNEVLIRVMRPEGPQPANFQVIGRPGG